MAKDKTAFDFEFTSLKGKPMPLSEFAGKPVIIVNTASKCGFTPQYKGLEEVWQRHKADGLVMLGVPSNDFAGQEPGTSMEIEQFCEINFGVDFPLTEKVHVKGADAHPLEPEVPWENVLAYVEAEMEFLQIFHRPRRQAQGLVRQHDDARKRQVHPRRREASQILIKAQARRARCGNQGGWSQDQPPAPAAPPRDSACNSSAHRDRTHP